MRHDTLHKLATAVFTTMIIVHGSLIRGQNVNSNNNINLSPLGGTGAPTVLGLSCIPENGGRPSRDTAVPSNSYYSCGSGGGLQLRGDYNGVKTDGSNGLTVAGGVRASTITASVNSQVNVQSYGAKGDCRTDDTSAFESAQNAAIAYASGNASPAVLYLPKPSGGCYVVSNWNWKGVSLEGQPSGLGPNSPQIYNVTLKSKPGQDILHISDPTITAGKITYYAGWSIRNVSFLVDNSIAGSFPHRWPGRWFDDGAMTAGSESFATTRGEVTCGDIGQAIKVNGAGPGGSNLVTKIKSVTPCWAVEGAAHTWQRIALAAAASATVSNAHSYISILGMPVTTNVGNAAIAADMLDGNPANWIATRSGTDGAYPKLENVVFTTTNGSNYNVAGIYLQGGGLLYGADIRNFAFYNQEFSVVQGTTEFNSYYQSSSGDFERWDHGMFLIVHCPWISYNGLLNRIEDVELTAQAGFQILSDDNQHYDLPNQWQIHIPEFENQGNPSAYGTRITGQAHIINSTPLSGAGGMNGSLDTIDTICNNCEVAGSSVNGYGNKIMNAGDAVNSPYFVDGGLNNQIRANYAASPIFGIPLNYDMTETTYKGSNTLVGRFTPDAMIAGNGTTPYNNDDLLIFPRDVLFNSYGASSYSQYVNADPGSPSGYSLTMVQGITFSTFSQFAYSSSGGIIAGRNLPLTGGTIYFSAKCETGTTDFTFLAGFWNRKSISPSQTYSVSKCNTEFQTFSFPFSWGSTASGSALLFAANGASNPFKVAWIDVVPYVNLGEGSTAVTQVLSDESTLVATDAFVKSNLPLKATTVSIGGSALTAGTCATGTVIVPGATTSMVAFASPVKHPGAAFFWNAYVSSTNTVTVSVCTNLAAGGTPMESTYNIRVMR